MAPVRELGCARGEGRDSLNRQVREERGTLPSLGRMPRRQCYGIVAVPRQAHVVGGERADRRTHCGAVRPACEGAPRGTGYVMRGCVAWTGSRGPTSTSVYGGAPRCGGGDAWRRTLGDVACGFRVPVRQCFVLPLFERIILQILQLKCFEVYISKL
jgi:hypothetical protein